MITYLTSSGPAPKIEVGASVEITDNSGLLMLRKSGVMELACVAACNANTFKRTKLTLVATGCQLPGHSFHKTDEPNQYIVIDKDGNVYFTNYIKAWKE
jgi:hypothetical protein